MSFHQMLQTRPVASRKMPNNSPSELTMPAHIADFQNVLGAGSIQRPVAHLMAILALIIATYIAIVILHRLFLHPLARYPGPFLSRITKWRAVYQAWHGRQHIDLHELHSKYGNIVRYAPDMLSVNDPHALHMVYGHKANTRKSKFYTIYPAVPGAVSTHTAIDPRVHARKRRVMSAAFSDSALKGMEKYVLVHLRDYLRQLEMGSAENKANNQEDHADNGFNKSIDIAKLDAYFAFDVMGELAYGKPFGVLGTKPENRRALFLVSQASRLHNLDGNMPWLWNSGLDRFLFRREHRHRREYLAFSQEQVAERMAQSNAQGKYHNDNGFEERRDFFYYIQHSQDPETGELFTENERWGESNTIIIAGADTTSTSTTATIFYLLHNPQCLERLTREIRGKFESIEEICTGPDLNSCTYLRSCIDEAMRMSPAVGILLERQVGPGGIEVLPDHHIPEGTIVGCPIYALHHHKDFVRDPFVYDPTRWLHDALDPEKEASIVKLRSVFNPFSIGPRSCIGKPMAYMEMTLTLARLVWQFDMRLPAGAKDEGHPREYRMWQDFVATGEGLKVDLRQRNGVS